MFVFGFRQNGKGLEERKSHTKIAQNLDVVSLGVVRVIFPLGRNGEKSDPVYN